MLRQLGDGSADFTHLIRDRYAKFTAAFNAVFAGEGMTLAEIPHAAPTATRTRRDSYAP